MLSIVYTSDVPFPPPFLFPNGSCQVQFLDKNNDALHPSLEQLMAVSKDDFVRKLFPEATRTSEVNTKKLALISVSSKFRVRSSAVLPRASAHFCVSAHPSILQFHSVFRVTTHHVKFLNAYVETYGENISQWAQLVLLMILPMQQQSFCCV